MLRFLHSSSCYRINIYIANDAGVTVNSKSSQVHEDSLKTWLFQIKMSNCFLDES